MFTVYLYVDQKFPNNFCFWHSPLTSNCVSISSRPMTLLAAQRYVPWSWSVVRIISSVPLERMLYRLPSNKPTPLLDLKPNAHSFNHELSYGYTCILGHIWKQLHYQRRSGCGDPKYGQCRSVRVPSITLIRSSLMPSNRGLMSTKWNMDLLGQWHAFTKFYYSTELHVLPITARKTLARM